MGNDTEQRIDMLVNETGLVARNETGTPTLKKQAPSRLGPEIASEGMEYQENVFRRHIKENPEKVRLARHKLWLDSLQHEYPLPFVPYRVGVYIRFFNQTKYSDEVYLEKHKSQFREDIACCPRWTLVDFYVDPGSVAPGMEYSKEWLRLLDDCFAGKVNLIVTQKVSNVSSDPGEIAFVARILATQKPPIGIYFVSEDIFTLASYYWADMKDEGFVPPGWKALSPDALDEWASLEAPEDSAELAFLDASGGEKGAAQMPASPADGEVE